MISIERLCTDVFDTPRQSLGDLYAGYLDHLARLRANNPAGVFTALITETEALAAGLTATATGVGVSQRTQQTAAQGTAQQRAAAEDRLRRNLAALTATIDSPAERQRLTTLLYPQGLTQYTEAKTDELPELLDTYLQVAARETAVLGADFVAKSEAALQPYTTARQQQVGQKGATAQQRQQRQAQRPDLTGQLTYNYHALSIHFRTAPERVATYFDPAYFNDNPARPTDAPPATPPVPSR